MSEYYGKYDKKQTVQLFIDNMIWGNISLNSFAFQMEDADNFRRSLEQSIIDFQKNPTEQAVDRIYEAIIRLRVHGAVSYVLRDVSAEEIINGLKAEIDKLRLENLALAEELHNTRTPPMNKNFSAHG